MSPKRGDRAAPPAVGTEWDIRFATSDAASGWEMLCKHAPGAARQSWDQLRADPLPHPPTKRQHPLRDQLARRTMRGRELDQWQYEVTGAGRIWYAVDEETRTLWVTHASTGHPKVTE